MIFLRECERMKTAIVTDSTAYLTKEERDQYNIHMIPLSVNLPSGTYEEEVTITAEEFYEKVRSESEFPKTTQPPVGLFVGKFEQLEKDYVDMVTIHLSSGISGTYNGAVQSSQMVEGVNVFAFDSEIACGPQGMFAIEAAKMAAQGMSGAEIIAELEELKKTMDAYFGQKVIVPYEKIRTRKKAMRRVEEQLAAAVAIDPNLQAVIIHANCESQGRDWLEQLAGEYPTVDFKLSYFGPVIGSHLGEGAIAMGWMAKK